MSEHPDFHHDYESSNTLADDEPDVFAYDSYEDYDEYSFEEAYEVSEDEAVELSEDAEYNDVTDITEQHIPYLPEDPAPEAAPPGIVWTKGRIFYAMLVMVFVLVLLMYMLVPVIDHFVNPPPPPILPPPWMA